MCKSPNLQREFPLPASVQLSRIGRPYSPFPTAPPAPIFPTIRQALAATRHLLEMYRRRLDDSKIQRKLQRLDKRLLAVASQLDRIATAEK